MKHLTTFELIRVTLSTAVVLLCFSTVKSEKSILSLSVKIEDNVSIESCSKILSNLEVRYKILLFFLLTPPLKFFFACVIPLQHFYLSHLTLNKFK